MQYKVVVSDLDGTLLDSNHNLSLKSIEAIQKLSAKGIKVILATGRHYIDVIGLSEKLNISNCIIASNGSKVYSGSGEQLLNHSMNYEAVDFMLDYRLSRNIHLNIYQGKNWFVFEENHELQQFHQNSLLKYTKISSKDEVDASDVNKFYLYSRDLDSLNLEEEYLKMKLERHCQVFFSYPTVLEIMPKGVNKGLALEELMTREGIDRSEVIAFGDALNDYEMLKWAGKGLLMENCDPKLRKLLPEHQQIRSNDQDGVANYIFDNLL